MEQRLGRQGPTITQSPIESIDSYRATLERAGLSPLDVNAKVNAYAATHPIVTEQSPMGAPIRLSKKAEACVQAARDAKIPEKDISEAIENAISAAAADHRRKAGLFGTSARFIEDLRDKTGVIRGTKGYVGTPTNRTTF